MTDKPGCIRFNEDKSIKEIKFPFSAKDIFDYCVEDYAFCALEIEGDKIIQMELLASADELDMTSVSEELIGKRLFVIINLEESSVIPLNISHH